MMHRLRDVQIALAVSLLAHPALAQNADFDQAMTGGFTQLAYGPGARVLVVFICGFCFVYGLTREHYWYCIAGILAAIGYFGAGVALGRMSIV